MVSIISITPLIAALAVHPSNRDHWSLFIFRRHLGKSSMKKNMATSFEDTWIRKCSPGVTSTVERGINTARFGVQYYYSPAWPCAWRTMSCVSTLKIMIASSLSHWLRRASIFRIIGSLDLQRHHELFAPFIKRLDLDSESRHHAEK